MLLRRTATALARSSIRPATAPLAAPTAVRWGSSFSSHQFPKEPVKKTTGFVGLPVDPEARSKMIDVYLKTLEEVNLVEPRELREWIKSTTAYRLKVVQNQEFANAQVEKEINCGQMEELLQQANNELHLVRQLVQLDETERQSSN